MENIIEQFSSLRDLGVTMSDNAKYEDHIEKVVKKKSDNKLEGFLEHFALGELIF